MTTNHVERLDPALIRPGRVDLSEVIDDSTPSQARVLFTRFYEGGEDIQDAEVEKLAQVLETIVDEEMRSGKRISMAALQGLFIRSNARDAITICRGLFVPRRI